MVIGPDVTCEMRPGEEGEVDALLRAAFPGPEEADLVRGLRRDGAIWAEFVQPWQGRIGAYAAISRMVEPQGWGCLAPVAVLPEWQRGALAPAGGLRAQYRFGTRIVSMIAHAVQISRKWTPPFPDTIVVLGEPAFYERCGFSLARAQRLISPYPLSHTMIARRGEDVPEETLVYPAAFGGV
jgi:putative acetyltransferase